MRQLGWNIEGQDLGSRRANIIARLKRYRPNYHLCLGDLGLARDLTAHVRRGIIYRVFDPFGEHGGKPTFDNSFWQRHPDPREVIRYLQQTHADDLSRFIWSVGNNEPTTRGQTADFVDWCVRLMEYGAEAGIRFAVAEIAVAKSIWHEEVEAGVWDNFVLTLDKYRDFGHRMTIHEYTTGLLPASLLPNYPYNLNEPVTLHPDNWGHAVMNMGSYEGNYHIGRGLFVSNVRPRELGIQPLEFIVTEGSFDWMPDVDENHGNWVTDNIRQRFPATPHDSLRGSTGHRPYHEWMMRETGYEGDWNDFLFDQYRWLVNTYPKELGGICIFALNFDWDIPEGHDMSRPRNDRFMMRIESAEKGQEEPPMTDFTPDMEEARLRNAGPGSIRVRNLPNLAGAIISFVPAGESTVQLSRETEFADGYNWHRIQTPSVTGYLAAVPQLSVAFIADEEPPAEPDPDIDIEELTRSITEAIQADINRQAFVDAPVPNFTFTVPVMMQDSVADLLVGFGQLLVALGERAREAPATDDAE